MMRAMSVGMVVASGLVTLLLALASIITGNSWLNIGGNLFADAVPAMSLMAITWLWLFFVSIIWACIRNWFWLAKVVVFLLLLFLASGVFWGLAKNVLFLINYEWPKDLNGASTFVSRLYDGLGISATWGTPLVIGIFELRICITNNAPLRNVFTRCSWFLICMAVAFSLAILRINEITNR